MRRAWLLWTIFAFCLTLGLAGMAWISVTSLQLERKGIVEENVRLALWRMDSAVAPLVAQENARPYFAYTSFSPLERAYTRMFNSIDFGDVLVPSPLLKQDNPLVLVHFQIDPAGAISSPQVPSGNMRDMARGSGYLSREQVVRSEEELAEVAKRLDRAKLLALLPASQAPTTMPLIVPQHFADAQQEQPSYTKQQAQRSINEAQARFNTSAQASNFEFQNQRGSLPRAAAEANIREGILRPLWLGDMLILARRINVNGQEYVQGCWLDWSGIRKTLIESISDLLPSADLAPAPAVANGRSSRLLASIPVRFDPGTIPFALDLLGSPVRIMLLAAWIGMLIAAGAVGVLLWGTLALSERRASFVSAVTHELRTPLTTVSMYAEMLSSGMVRGPEKQQEYLATLQAEAHRLGHLVENVLAYSRIERGRALAAPLADVSVPALLQTVKDRLVARAQQAEMSLCVEVRDGAAGRT